MSNKTTNQTQPFKPRIFPAPALTELALCLTQLLHLEYDGELEWFGFLCAFFFLQTLSIHQCSTENSEKVITQAFQEGLLTPEGSRLFQRAQKS